MACHQINVATRSDVAVLGAYVCHQIKAAASADVASAQAQRYPRLTLSGSTVTLLISAASACQRDTAGHHAGLRQPGGLMSVTEEVSPFMAWILIEGGA